MSKLYNQYVMLKINNPNKFFLFKSGIFFIFLDEDAKKMSKILNLKLGNLNADVVKCGFPENSLDKYMNILKNLNYEVEIINFSNQNPIKYQDYTSNSQIQDILKEIVELDVDSMSISQTYDFLNKIQKELADILSNVEE